MRPEKEANQAPEPTTLLVMSRACARATPAAVMSDLKHSAKKHMTRFDKLLIALAITWPWNAFLPFFIKYGYAEYLLADALAVKALYAISIGLAVFLPRAVFGYWLYFAAKNEDQKKWLWCAIGLSGGIYGVLVFYPYMIFRELRLRRPTEPCQRG